MSIDTPEFWKVFYDNSTSWASLIAYIDAQMERDRKDACKSVLDKAMQAVRDVQIPYEDSTALAVIAILKLQKEIDAG